jgi:hypothetical protein
MKIPRRQKGLALLMFVFVMSLLAIGYVTASLDSTSLRQVRDSKTYEALEDAKAALVSFSAETITAPPGSLPLVCQQNCPRPGDLPCPDTDNDGIAEASCNTQESRLGRLPWRTLGLGDLRDGSGELLWYAVSSQYKNNTRVIPLNSESFGTITLRDIQGIPVYNAFNNTGLAAVVIAPGSVLTRSDSLIAQNRMIGALQNIASNYLEVALGEDNANFVDGGLNGFISGEIKVGMETISNDVILPITRSEMNEVMEPKVLGEVMQALLVNFCPVGEVDIKNRTCTGDISNSYVPDPAPLNDNDCLTTLNSDDILNNQCNSSSTAQIGRIPVGGNSSNPPNSGWENKDSNSILRGKSDNNWFQQNGWREMIFYAVAPACKQSSLGCSGTDYLNLENAITPLASPSSNGKGVVVISAGSALTPTPRNKSNITDYLELEKEDGSILSGNEYSRYTHTTNRNDRVISVP